MTILIIDSDSLVYKACCACEHKMYDILPLSYKGSITDHTAYGNYIIDSFRYVKEYKSWLVEKGKTVDDFIRAERLEREPLSNALNVINHLMHTIIDAIQPEQAIVYLTGKDNFRDRLAAIKEYKVDRKDKPKPFYYKEAREFIQRNWHGVVVDNCEADDACSILQHSCLQEGIDSVIATIDKDLQQVPGWNYNFDKHILKYIPEEEADRFFYMQLLAGDRTDCIPGIPGVAEKTALKLLEGATSKEEMYLIAAEQYDAAYGTKNEKVSKKVSGKILIEMARLVYMLKNKDEMWKPPIKNTL